MNASQWADQLELTISIETAHSEADRLHESAEEAHREGREADADYALRRAAAHRMEAEDLEAKLDALGVS